MRSIVAKVDGGVVYAEPTLHAWLTFIRGCFVSLVLTVVAAGAMWGVIGTLTWQGVYSWWWHGIFGCVVLFVFLGIWWLIAPELRRRLSLMEDHLWIGGIGRGRVIRYEDVAFVRLQPNDGHFIQSTQLIIEVRGRRSATLVLNA